MPHPAYDEVVTLELALWQWLLIFAVSAVAVMGAGSVLARAGDAIATRTHLGGLFVGMLLMAAATSLPEIVTDASAAAAGAPDLSVGDLFGSSMANMAILAIIDLTARRRVWPSVELGHARLGAVAITLTAFVLLALVSPSGIRIGWVGIESLAVVALYVIAAAWVGRADRSRRRAEPTPGEEVLIPVGWGAGGGSLRRDLFVFEAASAVILVSGPALALSADGIAKQTGIAETFIGVTLLAVSTSLPELVASLAAVRIGAHDLAVGNLFGSNAFNMTVVLWIDLAYTDGPVLQSVSITQLIPGLGAILLMGLAIGALVTGRATRLRRGEPDAVLVVLAYVGLLVLSWVGAA
jgi:cation:H+ antiporter